MRKRIKCKKKSGSEQSLTTTQKILLITAILNLLNVTMNLAMTIVKVLDMIQ